MFGPGLLNFNVNAILRSPVSQASSIIHSVNGIVNQTYRGVGKQSSDLPSIASQTNIVPFQF